MVASSNDRQAETGQPQPVISWTRQIWRFEANWQYNLKFKCREVCSWNKNWGNRRPSARRMSTMTSWPMPQRSATNLRSTFTCRKMALAATPPNIGWQGSRPCAREASLQLWRNSSLRSRRCLGSKRKKDVTQRWDWGLRKEANQRYGEDHLRACFRAAQGFQLAPLARQAPRKTQNRQLRNVCRRGMSQKLLPFRLRPPHLKLKKGVLPAGAVGLQPHAKPQTAFLPGKKLTAPARISRPIIFKKWQNESQQK